MTELETLEVEVLQLLIKVEDPAILEEVCELLQRPVPDTAKGNRNILLKMIIRYLNSVAVAESEDQGLAVFLIVKSKLAKSEVEDIEAEVLQLLTSTEDPDVLEEVCVLLQQDVPDTAKGKKNLLLKIIIRHLSSVEVAESEDQGLAVFLLAKNKLAKLQLEDVEAEVLQLLTATEDPNVLEEVCVLLEQHVPDAAKGKKNPLLKIINRHLSSEAVAESEDQGLAEFLLAKDKLSKSAVATTKVEQHDKAIAKDDASEIGEASRLGPLGWLRTQNLFTNPVIDVIPDEFRVDLHVGRHVGKGNKNQQTLMVMSTHYQGIKCFEIKLTYIEGLSRLDFSYDTTPNGTRIKEEISGLRMGTWEGVTIMQEKCEDWTYNVTVRINGKVRFQKSGVTPPKCKRMKMEARFFEAGMLSVREAIYYEKGYV